MAIGLDENTPDHSTISRTRRLIDLETHQDVFAWVLKVLADRGLIKGKRIGIDATTLAANAAMRSIVRRDTEESYDEFLCGLANNPVNPKVFATAGESINLNPEGNTLRSWTGTRS